MKRFKISFDEKSTELNLAMDQKQTDSGTPNVENVVESLKHHFDGELTGKRIAVWGLTTNPLSNQHIGSASVEIVTWLINQGATVAIHDKGVSEAAVQLAFGDKVEFCDSQWQAANRSAAVIVGTDCDSYTYIDAGFLCWHVAEAVIFDVNDCVELGSNPANAIQHIAFKGNKIIDRCELVRFPNTDSNTLSQWQTFRVSAAAAG